MGKKTLILISLTLLALGLIILPFFPRDPSPNREEKAQAYRSMLKEIETLYEHWTHGPRPWICPDYFNPRIAYEQVYLQCNPNLLKCRLKDLEHLSFHSVTGTPESARFGLVLTYKKNDLDEKFIFYDKCREIPLPQDLYTFGEDIQWDNHGKKILFDRILVTRGDILHWTSATNPERAALLREINAPRDRLHFPALGLLLEEMRAFCRFQGKILMRAHIWDGAATLQDEGNFPLRHPYPWVRGKATSFLQQDFPLTPGDCAKAYIQECHTLVPLDETLYGIPSWSGMFQMLGGFMEALDNPFRPRRNLVLSSHLLPRHSPWHQLGQRGFWDGKGLGPEHIGFGRGPREEDLEHPLPIGFRCMRYE